MPQDPFPSPASDGEEPDGSLLPPATGTGPDAGRDGVAAAALAAGAIHPGQLRIIEHETSVLGAQDAAAANEELAGHIRALKLVSIWNLQRPA